jgi:hypothetical protein
MLILIFGRRFFETQNSEQIAEIPNLGISKELLKFFVYILADLKK